MVENQKNLCRFPHPDGAIFQPSKIKLVLTLSFDLYNEENFETFWQEILELPIREIEDLFDHS